MRKDYIKLVFVLVGFAALLFAGFLVSSKKVSFINTPDENALDINNTTWEIVQYSDGPNIENLVGTDWVLHFDQKKGFLRLCDTHPFSYSVAAHFLTATFNEKTESSCQESSVTSEHVFLDLLSGTPTIERVEYQSNISSEVLTLVLGTKKLVLIPRVDVTPSGTTGGVFAVNKKSVAITARYECLDTGAAANCPNAPFQGQFIFKKVTGGGEKSDKEQTTVVSTDATGGALLSLPLGTYQATLDAQFSKGVAFSPIIFSLVEKTEEPYALLLSIKKTP